MSDWVPSTEQVRSHYVFDQTDRWDAERGEAFDRWLDATVRQAKADALNEAADKWRNGQWADAPRCSNRIQERIANGQHVADWLRARAVAVSTGEVDHG